MREEVTPAQGVAEPELASEGFETVPSLSVASPARFGRDLDDEVVVGVTGKSGSQLWLLYNRQREMKAYPSNPYPETSFWKSTSLTGGRTSCECSRLSVEACSRRILVPCRISSKGRSSHG